MPWASLCIDGKDSLGNELKEVMCVYAKTVLPFCIKELKSYIQILKAKTEWQDQKLGKAAYWLELRAASTQLR